MGTAYSSLPTTDDHDTFAEEAFKDIKPIGQKRSKSMIINREPVIRHALHSDSVNCLAPVRPGMVISGSSDRSVIVHNMDTGECVYKWTGHEKEITKVIYKHVGGKHFVLSGSRDATAHLWRFNVPNPIQIYRGHEFAVTGLALVDDTRFMSGGRDASFRLWDVERPKPLRTQQIARNHCTHIEKFPQEELVCQTSEDRTLRIWDSRSLEVIFQSPARQHILCHCSVSSDDEPYCLTSSAGSQHEGCEVTLWDLRQRKILREFRGHDASVRGAIFLPQQVTWKRLIMSIADDHTARLWNLEDGQCLWIEHIATTGTLNSCVGFQDGTTVIAGDSALLCGLKLFGKAGRPLLHCSTMQSCFHNDFSASTQLPQY